MTYKTQWFDPVEKLLGKTAISAQIQLCQIWKILHKQKTSDVSDPVENFSNFNTKKVGSFLEKVKKTL